MKVLLEMHIDCSILKDAYREVLRGLLDSAYVKVVRQIEDEPEVVSSRQSLRTPLPASNTGALYDMDGRRVGKVVVSASPSELVAIGLLPDQRVKPQNGESWRQVYVGQEVPERSLIPENIDSRLRNALHANGIDGMVELSKYTEADFAALPNVGRLTVFRARSLLKDFGLEFRKRK